MYLQHFGLERMPFSNTPDTRFFYRYAAHQEALNVLQVAIRAGEGFIKIVGEVGTGKTLLGRTLLKSLGDGFVTAYLPNPFVNPNTLRMALADELGIDAPRNLGQHHLLKRITDRLIELARSGRRVVVIVDEAQSLPDDSLEALRLLTNLETERHKLLQLVLLGQPELDVRLERPGVRQLKQRISFAYRLRPLDRRGTAEYVEHRAAVAGRAQGDLFERRAIRALHRASDGLPRLINILAHKALMAAYGEGAARVARRHVRRAVADTRDSAGPGHGWGWLRPLARGASLLAVVALGFIVFHGWTGPA